ncbi:unnamed protein product, partial [Polarella glacialis]
AYAHSDTVLVAAFQGAVVLRDCFCVVTAHRPFHGYWRIRQSLKSASAASTKGGYQDFNFPLADIAHFVAEFANKTGVVVGGVDFIWQEADPQVRSSEPYTLEVSPTSDINPPTPADWKQSYAEFKDTKGFRPAYINIRRQWTDAMVLAVVDRYRLSRRHLFVGLDGLLAKSQTRLLSNWDGSSKKVMEDEPVDGSQEALRALRRSFFVRLIAARGADYKDPFNVTQTWLHRFGFEYDDLIIVQRPELKLAYQSSETLLLDVIDQGGTTGLQEKELQDRGLPFISFPSSSSPWVEVLPKILGEATPTVAQSASRI